MQLICLNHRFGFEMENIIRIFFPMEKLSVVTEDLPDEDGIFRTALTAVPDGACLTATVSLFGRTETQQRFVSDSSADFEDDCELMLASALCSCLTALTGYKPPWGLLTGVRPSKLMRRLIEDDGEAAACDRFMKDLEVSADKTALAKSVAKAEDEVVALSDAKSCSQYVSIPFCPTRCSYCSFVSHSVQSAAKLIPQYTQLLCEEIAANARYAKELGLRTETFYIGGGTPTSLNAQQLRMITDAVRNHIDVSSLREYTVEAGRPDTIDEEKLKVLYDAGVTRISVNPQTFSQKILENIGRNHSTEAIYKAFSQAREVGFSCINMDLIAGLPGDTPDGFTESLQRAIELDPENITVHTLALKRSSTLVTGNTWQQAAQETSEMLESAFSLLTQAGYLPYYMYRQSKSVGNLENVGWCKPGTQGLYNVYMMEEIHTVLAAGGGAVTKLKDPSSTRIERIFNFKYPYEYVNRFEELLKRKELIASFYASLDT
ncbi:MAG: coproporphyrinogen dehydrogenase HemZ [Clostridia bacterium]|nr:coproporphyrinogen dehydrogenase HemZ [Clostridia bacterium]